MELRLLPGPDTLPQLLDEAARFSEQAGWEALQCSQVQLILEELVVNAMTHGQSPPSLPLEVSLSFDGRDLELVIRDHGTPFDPTVQRGPAPGLPLAEQTVGGLGIFLTQQLSDEMVYQRLEGMNQVRIRKRMADGRSV